tara:strand:+ start:213 stop:518 length:306 start_codon:yes stop_codon:yes gene_type:complete
MIILAWSLYFCFSFFLSFLCRKAIRNKYLKKIIFAFVLSFFITAWFKSPGLETIAPIFSIFLMDLLESGSVNYERLIRPFLSIMFLIILIDIIFGKRGIRN